VNPLESGATQCESHVTESLPAIKNQKTALVAIAAIATVLAVSTIAIGNGRMALADTDTKTVTIHVNNTGVNVPTDTDQKQNCETAGGTSPVTASCTAASTDIVTQSGGVLKK
jgi:hypothetical protein